MIILSMMRRSGRAFRRLRSLAQSRTRSQTQAQAQTQAQIQAQAEVRTMRRGLLALSVLWLAAVPAAVPVARAAGTAPPPGAAPQAFRDLPGVKPQSGDLFGTGYRCETELRQVRQRYGVRFFGDGVPVRVYRCTRDGVVYESTEPPNPSGGWYPGVNPRIIDR
ncbi:MAG: hypothetical protein K0M55_16210 [Rhizobium sp.]|nr:hypothetical protein [Rhizobium sp.]